MLLIETASFQNFRLTEAEAAFASRRVGRRRVAEGIFGWADRKNDNGRIYPRSIWEHVIENVSEAMRRIESRNMVGELDHPDDGRTLLQRSSHLITALRLREDGALLGRAEILSTSSGRELNSLFEDEVQVGISSRGEGDLQKTESGVDMVQPGYALQAFDFVHNPSTVGAYPHLVSEGASLGEPHMNMLTEYRNLERSVVELASLKVSDLDPDIRRVVERQADETLERLSKLTESAGEHRPLFAGLLSELQAARRRIVLPLASVSVPVTEATVSEEADEMTIPDLKRLQTRTKSRTEVQVKGEEGNVEALTDAPEDIPLIPGSEPFHQQVGEAAPNTTTNTIEEEERDMAESAKKEKTLRALVREAESGLAAAKLDEGKANARKVVNATARKVESALIRKTKGYLSEMDLLPSVYEPAEEEGELDVGQEESRKPSRRQGRKIREMGGYDDKEPMENDMGDEDEYPEDEPMEMRYREMNDDEVDVGEPPEELMAMDNGEYDDEEDEEMPPMEAKLRSTMRQLVRECKRLQFEKRVQEAVAAKAIAKATRRAQIAEMRAAKAAKRPAFVEANGEKIPVEHVGAVIESIVEKHRAFKAGTGALTEGTEGGGESTTTTESATPETGGPFETFAPGNVRDLNEHLSRTNINRSESQSLLESQAALGARVAARIGPN